MRGRVSSTQTCSVNAFVMRQIDRRQRGAVIHRRQPAGIAMGEDVERLALLLRGQLADDLQGRCWPMASLIATSSSAMAAASCQASAARFSRG